MDHCFSRTLHWSMAKLLKVILLIILASTAVKSEIRSGKNGWSHELNLEEEHDGLKIQWKNTEIADAAGHRWLTMQVFARTKGYVGVGFSPNGGMAGADIVIGWVDSQTRKPHIKDFHGIANAQPILDEQQDYELISAKEDGQGTMFEFRRKWETCDDNDIDISNDTMRLIWAYSPFDPTLSADENSVSNLRWHGSETRGAQSTYIVDDFFATEFPSDDDPHVKHWDMLMSKNEVNAERTSYFCKILKLPQIDRKHQMIGYRPILQKENKKNVHHIVFFECMIPPGLGNTTEKFEKYLGHDGERCYTANMPSEWVKHCVTFLFAWVAGSEGEMLPSHVGSPLGEEHGGATYFMVEIHYYNPERRTFTDSSGVRIYYTDQLRPNDGSSLLVGYRITPFQLLPPTQDNFVIYGVCSAECTEKAFPEDGINVIITLVHAHLSARKIRMRHIRNGTELALVAEDNHYDFNYQQSRALKKEIKLLRGDEFIVECEYNTMDNDRVLLGGLATTQEMCQTFLMYYPRIDLMQCTSQYEFHDFFHGLDIDEVSGTPLKTMNMPYNPHILPPSQQIFDPPDNAKEVEESGEGAGFSSVYDHIFIERPSRLKGMSVGDYLKKIDWTDNGKNSYGNKVESAWKHSKHYAFCSGHGRRRIPLEKHIIPVPEIRVPLQKPHSAVCPVDSRRNYDDFDEKIIYYKEPKLKQDVLSAASGISAFTISFPLILVVLKIFS